MTGSLSNDELMTKADLQLLREDFAQLRTGFRRSLLMLFLPLWIGVYATLGVLIFSIVKA
jgi:hypothetical protein